MSFLSITALLGSLVLPTQRAIAETIFNKDGAIHPEIQIPHNGRGAEVPGLIGSKLAELAKYHHHSVAELKSILEHNASLRTSKAGRLHYVCAGLAVKAGTTSTTVGTTAQATAIVLADTFKLHSRIGSTKVIYLNFTGHTTTGTWWNSDSNVASIVTPPYDTDGNPSAFSSTELTNIQEIWQRVAEDYAPFEVDVTTEDPGTAAIVKSGTSDLNYGIRVCIGGSSYDWFADGAGGVTYLDSFGMSTDTPSFVFPKQLGNGYPKYVAEAVSHEVGHSFGLNHEGQTNGTEYYTGQGNWAPIMGVGYDKSIVQWSLGEYPLANNKEDEIAMIASYIPLSADKVGGDILHATSMGGSSFNVRGLIERRTDNDMYGFTTGAGSISFSVSGGAPSPNLNAQLTLYDGSGNLITSANPGTNLGATLTATVPQGTYYVAIDGIGSGSPTSTGFSDYGSLGQYTLTGTAVAVTNGGQPPVAVVSKSTPLTGIVPLTVYFSSNGSYDPDGSIARYDWDFGDNTTSTEPNPSHIYTKSGTYTPSLVVFDNTGLSSSAKLTVTAQPVVVSTKSLHVADIRLTLYYSYWYGYYVRAQVTVKDQAGVIIPGAMVTGAWSGLTTGTWPAKTNSYGVAALWSDSAYMRGTFNFAVTGISLTGYSYAQTQNTKTQASVTTP